MHKQESLETVVAAEYGGVADGKIRRQFPDAPWGGKFPEDVFSHV